MPGMVRAYGVAKNPSSSFLLFVDLYIVPLEWNELVSQVWIVAQRKEIQERFFDERIVKPEIMPIENGMDESHRVCAQSPVKLDRSIAVINTWYRYDAKDSR